jgi:hypothetical protein
MQYLHFLLTERASMRDSGPDRHKDLSAAEAWLGRAADARAEKVQVYCWRKWRAGGARRAGSIIEAMGVVRDSARAASTAAAPSAGPARSRARE